jgi:4'-phosphopantetheinyl transferase
MVRSIQIGAIQAIAVGRHPTTGSGARPSRRELCDIVALLIIAEDSVQAKRILSRWSRPNDAGSDTAAVAIQRRRQLGRAVLRKLLVEVAHFAPLRCRFQVEPEGRPFIKASNRRRPTSISLSHSGGWLAGALSTDTVIGIDIEHHRPDRDFAALASAAFGPQERRLAEGGGATEFYRIWTLREAMAKARGVGFDLVSDGRDHVTPNAVEASDWYLYHSEPVPGLSLAVAASERWDYTLAHRDLDYRALAAGRIANRYGPSLYWGAAGLNAPVRLRDPGRLREHV